MKGIDRRSAVTLGMVTVATPPLALATAPPAAAQTRGPAKGREIGPGVRQIDLSPPRPSKIQGFRTVSMREVVRKPGAEIAEFVMATPCSATSPRAN